MDEPDDDEAPATRDLYAALHGASPSSPYSAHRAARASAIAADMINGLY